MKTLKKGKKFPDKPWIGKKISCHDCKGNFQLEAGDGVRLISDQRDGDYYSVGCPNCRTQMTWNA